MRVIWYTSGTLPGHLQGECSGSNLMSPTLSPSRKVARYRQATSSKGITIDHHDHLEGEWYMHAL